MVTTIGAASVGASAVGRIRATLYALFGASACLLLIGCMNLSILLIGRASARLPEGLCGPGGGAPCRRWGRVDS